ncbi:protein of unknown function DUF58 [Paenibacillus curdlanolyticus YK9]|uniref:DUF58 domain-containing protein n=1 Tax=Paenibacillus curdlanolyticus YK9 TaxID=717606 RepID=E0I5T5_9BACL|nr:DUF58 domain-containing protein [Paenibacillus curdlanolyticus]EFM12327.1 protein of unknown function DUF58 [Paenibacillus curdlanolyticus YK9]
MGIYVLLLLSALIVIIQHRVFRAVALKRLSYSRQFDRTYCFEGDEVHMIETIANEKRFPLPWLRVESLLHASLQFGPEQSANLAVSTGQFMQNHRSFFSLLPMRRIRRTHRVKMLQRGAYTLSTVTLTAGDVFGMSATNKQFAFTEKLIVYPIPMLPEQSDWPARGWQGELSVRRWVVEDPFRRIGVRPYRAGDSMRFVNWRATARTGELQVHQLDTTADYQVLIVLNVEDHAQVWRDITDTARIERGIRLAAGIAEQLIHHGMEAGFAANAPMEDAPQTSIYAAPGSGEPHLYVLLERMARLKIERLQPFAEYLHALSELLEPSTDMVIVTAYVDDRLYAAAEQLEAEGHRIVFQLIDEESEVNAS